MVLKRLCQSAANSPEVLFTLLTDMQAQVDEVRTAEILEDLRLRFE